MFLEKIIVEGFLSYKAKQEIDLSNISTCLVLGRINDDVDLSNGAGKSSLFETIPVNFFGKGSGRADLLDSYINDSMSKMYLEIIFKIDSQRFKTVRSKTRNSSGLFEIFYDTNNEEIKKASWKKTDKSIEDILGLSAKTYSSTTYLNERESLQIITGTSSERKEILRELLNIEVYEKSSKVCNKLFEDLDKKIQVNINIIQDKQKQLEKEEYVKESLKNIELSLKQIKTQLELKEKELKQKNEEKQKIDVLIQSENLFRDQIAIVNREIVELENNSNYIKFDMKKIEDEVLNQTNQYNKQKRIIEYSIKQKKELEIEINEKEKIIKELDEIDKNLSVIIKEKNLKTNEKVEIEKTIAIFEANKKPIVDVLSKLERFDNVCPITSLECKILNGDFCSNFKLEKQNELKDINEKINISKSNLKEVLEKINEYTKNENKLQIKANSRQLENNMLAEAKLMLQKNINDINNFNEKVKLFNEYLEESKKDKLNLENKVVENQQKIKEKKQIVSELEKKIDNKLRPKLNDIVLSIEDIENDIIEFRTKIDNINQNIGELKNKIEEFIKIKSDIEHFLKTNEESHKQKKIYKELSIIFGKDGIQKSIMKESIPALEKYTSDFLKIFNEDSNRIKVKFDLDPKRQDGEFKKGGGLDILVLEEGKDPKDLQMYSGGETVRIVFSIVLSLAKLLSLRAGKKHETIIIDEKIAKLDSRGISQFGEVIHEISKIYKQVFIITHIETLKDMINGSEIVVNKTDNEGSLVTIL